MNADSKEPTPPAKKKTLLNTRPMATALLLLVVIFFWVSLRETRDQRQQLLELTQQLTEQLEAASSQLSEADEQIAFLKSRNSVRDRAAAEEASVEPEPVEEKETLFLQPPTLQRSVEGLAARFSFIPEGDIALPERVTLVVRVPSDSPARIISLAPTSQAHAVIEHVVNASGTLAMIEGSPADLQGLAFELTVSEPVKVTVRGSEGIKDFELDITPDGCTVRKL